MSRAWWKEAVVYQVYWRSFNDSDGDGYGDLQGLIEKLDYIKNLGVGVIWLNPAYESPDKDNGYDISNFYGIMSKAGTMQIFDTLLEETHRRGMKLIMDLVVNHTSEQHPWFLESRSSKTSPKRGWYIWKDPKDGGEPNNWRSYFSPSAWEWDERTGQYYFHSFAVEQPDLNWANAEMRSEIYRMMRYWLDKGVDGFRLDAIALLAKPEGFPDAADASDIRYLTNNPGLHEYLHEMNAKVLREFQIFTVGEAAFVTPEEGLKFVAPERQELDALFHFEVCDEMLSWDIRRFRSIQKRWYLGLWGKGWNSQFMNNHDHTRQVSRYGNDREYRVQSAKLLATMLHTLPGTPYIYQGEEIGMTGVRYPDIADYKDIALRNKFKEETALGHDPGDVLERLRPLARDNSRSPMQWSDAPNAGFTAGEPWIKVNPNFSEINVEKDLADPESIYKYYQKLIFLRKNHEVIIYGDYRDLSGDNPHLYVYTRSLEDTRWLVILNHSDRDTRFDLPKGFDETGKELMIANYADVRGEEGVASVTLRPHEARVYRV